MHPSSSPELKQSFNHILKHLKARSPESFSESERGGENFLSSPHPPQMKQMILKQSPPAHS